MMTLDEAIIRANEVAEENENVVNTRTFEDGYTIDEMYCDDTECINAHLFRCAKCAEEYRQLAEWLKDYKRLLEQEPCENKIIDEHYKKGFANGLRTAEWRYDNVTTEIRKHADRLKDSLYGDGLRHALEIIDKYRAESEEEE